MTESGVHDVARSGDDAFWRVDLSNALLLVSALLLGLYGVVRPVAFQWAPYSAESAMAGILASLFVLAAWGVSAACRRRASRLPDGVFAVLILWLGLHWVGLCRSPYPGAGVPVASEAGLAVALLLGGFAVARAWPGFVSAAVRLLVAGGVLEALLGFWQKFHDLPELRRLAERKGLAMPDILFTQQGQERLYSEEIFGTFGNANSYAGFLMVTIFLQLGVWLDAWRRSRHSDRGWHFGHALCLAIQLLALYISGSKGGWVAAVAGAWFVFVQLAGTTRIRKRLLGWGTGLGVAVLVGVLALATAGPLGDWPFPLSLRVRFDYWRTGWGMIAEQPWLGIGLSGFSEAYPQYKTALATETMLAHNDYLQLWAEMGILAPLTWLLLWFVILRPRASNASDAVVEAPATQTLTDEQVRTRVLSILMLVGGLLGALFMMLAFGRMHGSYLNQLFDPEASGDHRAGALAAFITPVCYAGAFLLLGSPRVTLITPPGSGLWIGVRAAVGAVLLHQLVDFDMTAQAIMAWLFLLGGFLLAQTPEVTKPGLLARVSRFAAPVLILLLIYGAVLVPLFSGQARDAALADEELLRDTRVLLQNVKLPDAERKELQQKTKDVVVAMTRAREEAFRWAPFDGAAALDLALAYLQLQRAGLSSWQPQGKHQEFALQELEDFALAQTRQLRPRWHGAPLVHGHVLLERGIKALQQGRREYAQACFRQAEIMYREARRLYPLSPSNALVVGDALLFQGKVEAACAVYCEAWEVDRRVLDPNVRFASVFHDPLPGCLVKHGRDQDIQERLTTELTKPGLALDLRRGFLIRQILVAAWQLLGARPSGTTSEIEQFMSKIRMIQACEALTEIAPNDGHAALFYALALKGYHRPELSPSQQLVRAQWEFVPLNTVLPAEQAWTASAAFALLREHLRTREPSKKAVQLQQESVRRGRPDTLPQVFDSLRGRL